MELRKQHEESELKNLSKYASFSAKSKGRITENESCDIRTEFQRDRDRIIHSKAFRRLKDKMQVFIAPEADHIRTRLMHTLEVSQIARTIARALSLNEDLTEAISLGHDLGHSPFGHSGEYALSKICPYGFCHNEQSVRVVERLERNGRGLNLTWEVRDGIQNHRTNMPVETLEGMVVQISDKIAYLNHDIDDSIIYGVINISDIPKNCIEMFGETSRQRINTMIRAVITESYGKPYVKMPAEIGNGLKQLRDFMFERVYMTEGRMLEQEKIVHVITELYTHFLEKSKKEINDYAETHGISNDPPEIIVCDYIAGMTDRYALNKYGEIFLPQYRSI